MVSGKAHSHSKVSHCASCSISPLACELTRHVCANAHTAIFSWRATNQSQELQARWMLANTSTSRKYTMIAPRKQNRLPRPVGVEQYRSRQLRNTFLQAILRPLEKLVKPVVFISCFYYCLAFAWVIGINTTPAIFLTPLQIRPETNRIFLFYTRCRTDTGFGGRTLAPRLHCKSLYQEP